MTRCRTEGRGRRPARWQSTRPPKTTAAHPLEHISPLRTCYQRSVPFGYPTSYRSLHRTDVRHRHRLARTSLLLSWSIPLLQGQLGCRAAEKTLLCCATSVMGCTASLQRAIRHTFQHILGSKDSIHGRCGPAPTCIPLMHVTSCGILLSRYSVVSLSFLVSRGSPLYGLHFGPSPLATLPSRCLPPL